MTRIRQPFTWLSVALTVMGGGWVIYAPGLAGSTLLLLAQVCALSEFKKYTGRSQFFMIVASAIGLGLSLDLPKAGPFLATGSLGLSALAIVLRQAFLPTFTYMNKRWMEPLLLLAASIPLALMWLTTPFGPDTHLFPLLTFGAGLFLAASYSQDAMMMGLATRNGYRVQPGMPAPDFDLPDQHGASIRLIDHKGLHPVLLIFVRGDWCPGCHMMLRTYEKHNERFKSRGVHVIGIGPDSVEVNRDMVSRIGVGYQLLSDTAQEVSQRYGVVYENPLIEAAVNYAEGIPLPASFLIDTNGIVRYVSRPDRVGEFLDPTLIFGVLDRWTTDLRSQDHAHPRAA